MVIKDFIEKGRQKPFLSQLYHFLAYSIIRPKMQLDKAMIIISIDVDVGSKELGVMNKGKNDLNVRSRMSEYQVGEIEEVAIPLFVSTFDDIKTPVTFAIRGQLTEVSDSILKLLLKSSVEHDIGAHGYYHRNFTDLSRNEAEHEFTLISSGMMKHGIMPRSFVFPKNRVAHLELLGKYGYKCYRSRGGFVSDCMSIEKQGRLYDVRPSLCLDRGMNPVLVRKIVDVAVTKKLPFHIWFHLWDFGETSNLIQRSIKERLVPLLDYAKSKERRGKLTFETMLSAAEEIERLGM